MTSGQPCDENPFRIAQQPFEKTAEDLGRDNSMREVLRSLNRPSASGRVVWRYGGTETSSVCPNPLV